MLPTADLSTSVLFSDPYSVDRVHFTEVLQRLPFRLSDTRSHRCRIGTCAVSISASRLCNSRTRFPGPIRLRSLSTIGPPRSEADRRHSRPHSPDASQCMGFSHEEWGLCLPSEREYLRRDAGPCDSKCDCDDRRTAKGRSAQAIVVHLHHAIRPTPKTKARHLAASSLLALDLQRFHRVSPQLHRVCAKACKGHPLAVMPSPPEEIQRMKSDVDDGGTYFDWIHARLKQIWPPESTT